MRNTSRYCHVILLASSGEPAGLTAEQKSPEHLVRYLYPGDSEPFPEFPQVAVPEVLENHYRAVRDMSIRHSVSVEVDNLYEMFHIAKGR